jgi:signal transduction histidine kinase
MYATLVITPLGLYLILLDDQELIILGSSLFIFLLANILMSFNVERSIVDMIVLRDNNEKLITELRAQKNIAEQSNIGKSKFLAAISHDLRQPMHAMGLFLNGLEPYVRKPGEEVFNKVQNSAIALRSLFNGLLDISRLDSGVVEPTLEVINLAPFLQKIIDGFHGEAEEKGLTLKYELLQLGVRSDPMLLERVIRNLLANAIQYTDSGQVKLVASRQDDRVTITIEDEGRGIPKDELNNIFSEYHQLHNAERDRSKGVGLGLAIVRRICTLLSIPIEVRSYLGQGSTFKISLPVADITTLKTTDISRSPWNLHGYLIVVVDDEQDIRDATERLLKEWGCDTIVVGSGSEAIEQLSGETEMPKLLIVDYRLREETGIDVIAQIRSLYTREVSAMIVTGDTMVDLKKVAGENDLVVLHKPVSPAELRTAIHLLISQQNKNE